MREDGLATAARTPVPLRLAVALPPEFSAMIDPLRIPVTDGVNVTVMVQLAPAAKVFGMSGQLVVSWKSLRLTLMPSIVTAVV